MVENKIKFLTEVGKLKHINRRGWVLKGVQKPETVSGHMYRMSLFPFLILSNKLNCDFNKMIKLCIVHDMAECIVGDITPHDNVSVEEKHCREEKAIKYLATLLPHENSQCLINLYNEYEEQKSIESQISKDLDLFDMILQAFEYEKSEYERTGVVCNLQEFFSEKNIDKLKNKEIIELVTEILKQRSSFYSSLPNVIAIPNSNEIK